MKYIITESQHNKIKKHLSDYLEKQMQPKPSIDGNFIILWEKYNNPISVNDEDEDVAMEYDYSDGRLYIGLFLRRKLWWFPFKDKEELNEFLKDWFEKKFKVEVKFVA
jgi:hypothetical protein